MKVKKKSILTVEMRRPQKCTKINLGALSMALEITAANVFLSFTFASFCSEARSPYAGHSWFCIHNPPASTPLCPENTDVQYPILPSFQLSSAKTCCVFRSVFLVCSQTSPGCTYS